MVESRPLDVFYPFFDLEMLDILPDGETLDPSQHDMSLFSLDYLEL